jgi:hypothetical protein
MVAYDTYSKTFAAKMPDVISVRMIVTNIHKMLTETSQQTNNSTPDL